MLKFKRMAPGYYKTFALTMIKGVEQKVLVEITCYEVYEGFPQWWGILITSTGKWFTTYHEGNDTIVDTYREAKEYANLYIREGF